MTILDVTETSKQVDYSYERTSGGSHQGAVESEQVREHFDGPSSERGRLRATAVQSEESQARTGASPLSSRRIGFLRAVWFWLGGATAGKWHWNGHWRPLFDPT